MSAKKSSIRYVCSHCGASSAAWAGKCRVCGEWNTLVEQLEVSSATVAKAGRVLVTQDLQTAAKVNDTKDRLHTGITDIDTVLGGGIVPGSVVLLAGEPGIGKSTLLLQLAEQISKQYNALYVSGEESAHQIGRRASRLGAAAKNLQLATSNSANDIASTIAQSDFSIAIIDSIQTLNVTEIASAPGSVAQITNSTRLITEAAKAHDTALIIVGHVTKEGTIAGPKVLEHLVDVVLQLEGDRYGGFKILRSIKNRFGSTSESGIFEMTETGLQPVANPSAALLAERQVTDGSVVAAIIEGSRALLVEVQALVNITSYGYPKRTASGMDGNRLNLLIAMLERRTKLKLSDKDIYVNIVGGLRLTEPAADLAVCMAIASATKGMQLKKNAVVFGEVGLSGEVRHVPFIEKRVAEAAKLGFDTAIGPRLRTGKKPPLLQPVADVRSALNAFLEKE